MGRKRCMKMSVFLKPFIQQTDEPFQGSENMLPLGRVTGRVAV